MTQVHAQRNSRGFLAATFLLIGLAVANWPTHAAAQTTSPQFTCEFESTYR